eukprot:2793227-Amphidinium_carterae.1
MEITKIVTVLIVRMPLSGIAPLKPAFWEHSLKAVYGELDARDRAHPSEAALRNRSFKAVAVNIKDAHSTHHSEPAFREHSLEAVCADFETCDCAHGSDAALGNRSFEA